MKTPDIEQALVTNLSRVELRQCAQAARQLAKQAARNHGAAVEEVSAMMATVQHEIAAELVSETGDQYGVTIEQSAVAGFEMSHVIAFSQFRDGAVVCQPFSAIVQTRLFTNPTPTCMMVGYETTGRTLLTVGDISSDAENPDTPCFTDLIKPRVIEERVV